MIDKISWQEPLGQENNNLASIKQQAQDVICRVFFLRHGQSEDEAKNNFLPQDSKTPLSPLGIEQIEKAAGKFQELWLNDENTVILYAKWTERIRQSKKILETYNIWVFEENPLLETTEKKYNKKTKQVENTKSHRQGIAEQLKNIVDLVDGEILKVFQEKNDKYTKKKNIILLGHKSSEAFHELPKQRKENIVLDGLRIKPGEIFEMDININNELINYEQHKEILHITSEKYKWILEVLGQEKEIEKYIEQLTNKKIQLHEFQNLINKHFQAHPELYEKYLWSENEDLRVFCLIKLLDKKEYEHIDKTYMESKHILSQIEKEILILQTNTSEIEKLIVAHFVTKEELRDKEEGKLFASFELSDFYEELKKRRETYEKAVKLQSNSIDDMIKNKDKQWILEREMMRIEKKEKNKETVYEAVDIDMDKIIKALKNPSENVSKDNKWRYILPGHVGQWKSIWLSELVKKLAIDPEVSITFLEWSDFNNKKLEEVWGEKEYGKTDPIIKFFQTEKGFIMTTPTNEDKDMDKNTIDTPINYTIGRLKRKDMINHINIQRPQSHIVCIDAIDEIKDEKTKETVKQRIKKDFFRTVSTSRLSEYNDKENDWFITLNMKPVNTDEFINSRIKDLEKREIIKEKIEQSQLTWEIGGNPLLLSFICKLANEEWKYKEIWIEKFENILNKADLYENIVKLILYEHQATKAKNEYQWNNKDIIEAIEQNMDILWEYAYFIYQCNYHKNIDWDFEKFKKDKKITNSKLNQLNILFKRTENGWFGFIHKSFEEYFLARHLTSPNKIKEWDKEIYHVRDTASKKNWNERKAFKPVVDFYWEILVNQNQIETLQRFLWKKWILKNDDAFLYNFSLCLNILSKIENSNKNRFSTEIQRFINELKQLYKETIKNWKDEETIIAFFCIHGYLKNIKLNRLKDTLYDRMIKIDNDIHIWFIESRNDRKRTLTKKLREEDKHENLEYFYTNLKDFSRRWIPKKYKWVIKFVEKEEFIPEDIKIDLELAKIGNEKAIKYVNEYVKKSTEKKMYLGAAYIYIELGKLGDKQAIEYVAKWAKELTEENFLTIRTTDIYLELAKIGDNSIIQQASEYGKKLMEHDHAEHFYTELIKIDNEQVIKCVAEWANKLFVLKKYEEAGYIYEILAKTGKKTAMKYADEWAKKLFKIKQYNQAGNIYIELANLGDKWAIQKLSECIKKLIKKINLELIENVIRSLIMI